MNEVASPAGDGAPPPLVSVIIASVNGLPSIVECLAALVNQKAGVPYEVLVLDCCDQRTRDEIRRLFPQPEVRLIPMEERLSIPKLRALGMTRARGRMIAILEDHCNVGPDWFRGIERAHAAGHEAIGGPVENGAVDRLTDWAAFFCEYVRFMPPLAPGVVSEIAGSSAVYDRRLLDRLGPELQEEVWEYFLHQRIRELSVPFYCDPDLAVSHKKEFGFGYFMSQRYHYSRSFAGMRLKAAPAWKRVGYAGATVILPPLLLWRMATTVWRKGRHGKTFLQATPILAIFLVSYAWGEAVGALLGPGDSLARVE